MAVIWERLREGGLGHMASMLLSGISFGYQRVGSKLLGLVARLFCLFLVVHP
jgi:hypothetical protein